jgi:hypothetical protein
MTRAVQNLSLSPLAHPAADDAQRPTNRAAPSVADYQQAATDISQALSHMQSGESRMLAHLRVFFDRLQGAEFPAGGREITVARDQALNEIETLLAHASTLRERAEWLSGEALQLRTALENGREVHAALGQAPANTRFEAAWRQALEPRLDGIASNVRGLIHQNKMAARVAAKVASNARNHPVGLLADLHRWIEQSGTHERRETAAIRIIELMGEQEFAALELPKLGLTSLPRIIGHLPGLTYLSLADNPLETLPPDIAKLQKLRVLVCTTPAMTQVPAVVWSLHPDCKVYFREMAPEVQQQARAMADSNGGPRIEFHAV